MINLCMNLFQVCLLRTTHIYISLCVCRYTKLCTFHCFLVIFLEQVLEMIDDELPLVDYTRLQWPLTRPALGMHGLGLPVGGTGPVACGRNAVFGPKVLGFMMPPRGRAEAAT
ncbi:hypothetical protein ACFX2I_004150 [Malus domestica]